MIEESRMDKKSNRCLQQQSRAPPVDCKKTVPELANKPWPRNNKKREGNNFVSKNEQFRKNVPTQKKSQVDRRPRARGSGNYAMGRTQSPGIDEYEEPEVGSVLVPGTKKQSLNHLLKFTYTPRGGDERRSHVPQRRQMHRVFASRRHEHDLYLRAYCQFVVKTGEDYTFNLHNPDLPIKWDHIEEIVVRSTGKSECPVCLGAPVAARVGLCGHVYCWACVLHYAATHDKQPPPCPVCTSPMNVKNMKPARMLQWKSPEEMVTMQLVRRSRDSNVVEVAPPRGQLTEPSTQMLAVEQMENSPYAKLFEASKKHIHDRFEREKKEIEDQILAEIDTSELVYLEEALKLLKEKELQFNNKLEQYDTTAIAHEILPETTEQTENNTTSVTPIVYEKHEVVEKKFDWFDVTEEGATCLELIEEQIQDLAENLQESTLNPEAPEFNLNMVDQPEQFPLRSFSESTHSECEEINNSNTDIAIDEVNKEKYFYFYQAEDGQQVFLHRMNVLILNRAWTSLVAAPPVIRGRVLHRETFSVDEETRKHTPCAAHLPLYCSYDVVELDLQPPYVTDDAINGFSAELQARARQRARLEREEKRRERAHRRALEGPPRPDFTSELLFPPAVAPPAPPSPPAPPRAEPAPHGAAAAAVPATDAAAHSSPGGLSFAKMASTSGTWRVRKPSPPPSPHSPPSDGEAAAPRTLNLSDAIEAALNATTVSTVASAKKKNKKSKQKLLFTTGMHHVN